MALGMRLRYLVANAAYAFTLGDSIVPMRDVRFHESKAAAIKAAEAAGLKVDRQGNVTTA